MSPTKPEPKQYSLTAHEANMLRFVNNHQNAIFSGLLSTIAGSRLGYTVTERTQFQLSPDFSQMTLMELEVPEEAKAEQATAQDNGSPVVTAPESKEAHSEPTTSDSNDQSERTQNAEAVNDTQTVGQDSVGDSVPTADATQNEDKAATDNTQGSAGSESATQLAPAEGTPEPQAPTNAS